MRGDGRRRFLGQLFRSATLVARIDDAAAAKLERFLYHYTRCGTPVPRRPAQVAHSSLRCRMNQAATRGRQKGIVTSPRTTKVAKPQRPMTTGFSCGEPPLAS